MIFDIVGAGIGGLTTAIAMERKGMEVQVFEQATELKPVGAGIILANNAMQVYDKLGLKDAIAQCGNPISSINITDMALRPLSKTDLRYFEDKYGVQNVAIHRGKLQQILAGQLGTSSLKLNCTLKTIKQKDDGFLLGFEKGDFVTSKTLIGADGLHSTVRKLLFKKGTIRNPRQICWRGIAPYALPHKLQHELNEAWGQGNRFGFVKIGAEHVYWYAVQTISPQQTYSVNALETYFKDYHPLIGELLQQTPKATIHTAQIEDLRPLPTWWQGNACLLGDAAHATTPNLGQGACQAIEDAHILSECLSQCNVHKAFSEYQRLRKPKAHRVVNASWSLGKMAHWRHPVAIGLRNQLMKSMPAAFNRRQSERIFKPVPLA
ncbi:MAG: FAD-dependent monooxygenase [Flavobacteriaceae bacterium]